MAGVIRRLAQTDAGLRVRGLLGIRPPIFAPRLCESVSDLFVWRCDDSWETWFDLFHGAGLVNPDYRDAYDAEIVVFDATGNQIASRTHRLEFLSLKRINLADEFSECRGQGTFAVFHRVDNRKVFAGRRTCFSELGYTSYRRRQDKPALRSYVHGNLYVLGFDQESGRCRSLGVAHWQRYRYRPQMRLDDCRRFELFLPNPVAGSLAARLQVLDASGATLAEKAVRLRERELFAYRSDEDQNAAYVQLFSRFPMLRPVVFKYFATHFDVLHA